MYYDTNCGEMVTLEQLRGDYETLKADDPENESYETFETFLHNSLLRYGGCLEKVA